MSLMLAAATLPDTLTFAIAAVIVIGGALGVVFVRNPVHSALMLVMTLFGVAVLFVEEDAQFLAAVQVIVYAGAIVVLFLFVIMLIGVDRKEQILAEAVARSALDRPRPRRLVLAEVILLGTRALGRPGRTSVAGVATSGAATSKCSGRRCSRPTSFPSRSPRRCSIVAVVGAVVLARRHSTRRVRARDRPSRGDGARRRTRRGELAEAPSEPSAQRGQPR